MAAFSAAASSYLVTSETSSAFLATITAFLAFSVS